MQETQYRDAESQLKHLQEFFSGKDKEEITEKMDTRLKVLQEKGHTLIKRVEIGRNQLCPCGSGKKFKKCCISTLDEKVYGFMERGRQHKNMLKKNKRQRYCTRYGFIF